MRYTNDIDKLYGEQIKKFDNNLRRGLQLKVNREMSELRWILKITVSDTGKLEFQEFIGNWKTSRARAYAERQTRKENGYLFEDVTIYYEDFGFNNFGDGKPIADIHQEKESWKRDFEQICKEN